jgi:hypothetical protein
MKSRIISGRLSGLLFILCKIIFPLPAAVVEFAPNGAPRLLFCAVRTCRGVYAFSLVNYDEICCYSLEVVVPEPLKIPRSSSPNVSTLLLRYKGLTRLVAVVVPAICASER